MAESLTVTLDKIRYHDRGFLIALGRTSNGLGATIKGRMMTPQIGLVYQLEGHWLDHPRFGRQFDFANYTATLPVSPLAVRSYLAENAPNIGPVLSGRLVAIYGEDALKVLKETPERASHEITGLSLDRALEAAAVLRAHEKDEALHMSLRDIFLNIPLSKRIMGHILDAWKHEAPAVIRDNPFRLCLEIEGIGWPTADLVATRLGFPPEHPTRIRTGLVHCLGLAAFSEGHTYMPIGLLTSKAKDLLSVSTALLEDTIDFMVKDGELVADTKYIYTPPLYAAETNTAANLAALARNKSPVPIEPLAVILPDWLTAGQKAAILRTLDGGVSVITGPPGCLAGDSVIEVSRCRKSFRTSIRQLVYMFNGGRASGKTWDLNVPTYVRARDRDGYIRLSKLETALVSGKQLTYEVTTESGRKVRATAKHPFLTPTGWKPLHDLTTSDSVYVDAGIQKPGKQKKLQYKEIHLPQHPFHKRRGMVLEHRIVAEAELSGFSIGQFILAVRAGRHENLKFLDPKIWSVHHEDHDTSNNDPLNLSILRHGEHNEKHGIEHAWKNVTAQTVPSKIVSICEHKEEETFDLSLTDEPHNFLANGIVVHNTGKTTVVKEVLAALPITKRVALCAPTGRAARRLMDQTGRRASTIHMLLGPTPNMDGSGFRFEYTSTNPLPYDVVIVDETSMVDIQLASSLLEAIPSTAHLILVGDVNQLPSVGPGSFMKDVIESGVASVSSLTEIKRQGAGLIVRNCSLMLDGYDLDLVAQPDEARDLLFVDCEKAESIKDTIVELVANQQALLALSGLSFELSDVQVIAPMREKTDLSCKTLNAEMQDVLIGDELEPGGYQFKVNDKVVQLRNDYGRQLVNGDIGYVAEVDTVKKQYTVFFDAYEGDAAQKVIPAFDNELALAWAVTVHKYQGSESPVVIIPIHRAFSPLLMQLPLLYTAISRASKLCVLVGHREEILRIVNRNAPRLRWSRLKQRLAALKEPS